MANNPIAPYRELDNRESKIEWAKKQFIRGAFDIPDLENEIEKIYSEKLPVEELVEFEVDNFPGRFVYGMSMSVSNYPYYDIWSESELDKVLT
jgi:hypothetical protein